MLNNVAYTVRLNPEIVRNERQAASTVLAPPPMDSNTTWDSVTQKLTQARVTAARNAIVTLVSKADALIESYRRHGFDAFIQSRSFVNAVDAASYLTIAYEIVGQMRYLWENHHSDLDVVRRRAWQPKADPLRDDFIQAVTNLDVITRELVELLKGTLPKDKFRTEAWWLQVTRQRVEIGIHLGGIAIAMVETHGTRGYTEDTGLVILFGDEAKYLKTWYELRADFFEQRSKLDVAVAAADRRLGKEAVKRLKRY